MVAVTDTHNPCCFADVTNASRTLLMDLQTLQWDDGQVKTFNIPKAMLPAIK